LDSIAAGKLSARERREQMLVVVRDHDFVRVAELGSVFGVSEMTVRTDLDALSERGALRRVRGGAVQVSPARRERPFEETSAAFAVEKSRIGYAAAQLVNQGETIILDVGTTTTAVARALLRRDEVGEIVVITNALNIALELEAGAPRITVIVTGGTLRPLQHSLINPMGDAILERIAGATLFLGCNGVHPVAGVTNINLQEADIKLRMLRAARRRIVVADGSKLGEIEVARLCGLDEVDVLVTGSSAQPEMVKQLRLAGLEVLIAS
jgi:DeoR family transcriptional regulator, aga operon transcriptional repressor